MEIFTHESTDAAILSCRRIYPLFIRNSIPLLGSRKPLKSTNLEETEIV